MKTTIRKRMKSTIKIKIRIYARAAGAVHRENPMYYLPAISREPCPPTHECVTHQARAMICTVIRWGTLLLLVTQFLFAHGCHGDEDHELFGIATLIGR
jgi:hypothetical protein